jgi:hypothetical protein
MLLTAAVLMATAFTACSDDDSDNNGGELTANELSIQALSEQYVKQVVFPTYTNLADNAKTLADELVEARDKFKEGTLTDAELEVIGETFLSTRACWEASEAFLYGPATTFGIDPHIDTWPLDADALATGLNNPSLLAKLEDEKTGASDLAPTLLGFHAIEFIIFRDGNLRTVSELKQEESDEAFTAINAHITGEQELTYAAAVANDLMQRCFQLQVAWMGEAAGKERVEAVEEEWELESQVVDDYYGENMLNAGKAGSSFRAWQDVLVTILNAGCSNICNEVANTKIGNAWTGQDVNYIESPYSKKSFADFYDNIMSIKNTLYGGINLGSPNANSFMAFAGNTNASLAADLEARLQTALDALTTCKNGKAFVDIINSNDKPQYVQAAIDAINALDDKLQEAADWAAKVE